MKADRWRRVEDLFVRAADLAPEERSAFLAAECGDDAALRTDVERMLNSDDVRDDAFSRVETHARRAPVDPLLGRMLGVYRLVERLGAGGMGIVYRAERSDGLFAQEVAIKLIHGERSSEWLVRRFEFERRTLAALEHPNIARVLDGGTTEDGDPYLVMELVRGATIDRYCEQERLTLAARARLFVAVCRAVHHAHQSLVVHCDLKPANILIDAHGEPRLLDFGIARLLGEGPLGEPVAPAEASDPVAGQADAAAPRTLARVLTPEYASPEQLAGGPVTTALDVYSLGVVLYELTTGRRPFQSDSRRPADWADLLRARGPERPSTRAVAAGPGRDPRALAGTFGTTPGRLRRALRGDLDAITLTALQRDPLRRYTSAQELADDVERHLAGRPVRARPASLLYTATKFVRRNGVAVGAALAVLAALLYGLVSARRSERVAAAEAAHARIEADSFQGVANFLMDAFLPAQPQQDAEWLERARQSVLAHAERVERQFAGEDHVRANMLDALGRVCMRLDLVDDAQRLLDAAAGIRLRAFGPDSIEHALSLRALGQLAYQAGDLEPAAQLLSEALAIHRAARSSTHSDVASLANDLAAALRGLGRERDAEALHEEALALRRAADPTSLPVAESLNNVAALHLARGEGARAVAELRESLAIRSAVLGDAHPLTLQTLSNLATVLWQVGEPQEALDVMGRAEAGYRALRGDGEDALGTVLANRATMQSATGDRAGANASLVEALALHERRLGPTHPTTVTTLAKLAALDHVLGRDDDARARWQAVIGARRAPGTPPRPRATSPPTPCSSSFVPGSRPSPSPSSWSPRRARRRRRSSSTPRRTTSTSAARCRSRTSPVRTARSPSARPRSRRTTRRACRRSGSTCRRASGRCRPSTPAEPF